jgi:hypothetical protein
VAAIIARTLREAIVEAVQAGDFAKAQVLGQRLAELEARLPNAGLQTGRAEPLVRQS